MQSTTKKNSFQCLFLLLNTSIQSLNKNCMCSNNVIQQYCFYEYLDHDKGSSFDSSQKFKAESCSHLGVYRYRDNPKSGSAIEIQNGFPFGTGLFYCWFQIDGIVAISVHCTRTIWPGLVQLILVLVHLCSRNQFISQTHCSGMLHDIYHPKFYPAARYQVMECYMRSTISQYPAAGYQDMECYMISTIPQYQAAVYQVLECHMISTIPHYPAPITRWSNQNQ